MKIRITNCDCLDFADDARSYSCENRPHTNCACTLHASHNEDFNHHAAIRIFRIVSEKKTKDKKMRTRSMVANRCSGIFTRRASLLVTLVGASALVFIEPVFAQTDYDTGTPNPIGSRVANPADAPDPIGSTVVNPADAGDATPPSFDEPWVAPSYGAEGGAAGLVPAPQSEAPEQSPIYTPPPPVGLIETPGRPPVPYNNPQFLPPETMARPEGRFGGYAPEGRFNGYAR